jgi:dipeptidyl aminopeptidase/acylaminoacyl peptidase
MSINDVDRLLATWLASDAPMGEPDDLLEQVLARTRRTRRRQGWLIPERWLSMQLAMRWQTLPRIVPVVLLLVALLVVSLMLIGPGSQRIQLPAPFGPATDGRFAYVSNGQIWTADRRGNDTRQITTDASTKLGLTWSRDGTRLAFVASSGPAGGVGDLVIVDADGSDPITIQEQVPALRYFSWSPDGRSIAFSYWTTAPGQHDRVFVAPSDGSSPPVQIGQPELSAFYPAYSPDGTRIAFISDHSDRFALHVMDADGSDVRELTRDIHVGLGDERDANARGLEWSPDGRSILFTADNGESRGLYVVPADGSAPESRILDGPGNEFGASWSPDGREIVFLRTGDPADGPDVVVAIADPSLGTLWDHWVVTTSGPYAPQLSPSGEWIAVVEAADGGRGTVKIVHVERHPSPIVYSTTRDPAGRGSAGFETTSWQRLAP